MSDRSCVTPRRLGCAVTVALSVALTGCHVNQPPDPAPRTDAAHALDQLRALPSLEDTTEQLRRAMSEITSAASRLMPSITWQTPHEGTSGNCERPYEQTGGQRYFLPDQIAARAAVSEDDWTRIEQVARESAAGIGATDVQVVRDGPGDHDVWFTGPAGLYVKVGYHGNLGVAGYTGCRLPRGSG